MQAKQNPLVQLAQSSAINGQLRPQALSPSSTIHSHSQESDAVQAALLAQQRIQSRFDETTGRPEHFYGHHPDPSLLPQMIAHPPLPPQAAAIASQAIDHRKWTQEFSLSHQPAAAQERAWSAGSSSSSSAATRLPIHHPVSRLHSINSDIIMRTAGYSMQRQQQQWNDQLLHELDKKWTEEFDAGEAGALKPADWDHMFSAVEANKIDISENQSSTATFDKAFEETWKSLDAVDINEISVAAEKTEQSPISDELDLNNWDDEYSGALADSFGPAAAKQMEFKEYSFEQENQYKEYQDPYAEGMRLLETGGSLTEAALAFEAAVQLDPRHANAWAMLGKVQAENEKEEPAISALQHALNEDPQHLDALMALAVSYTNEGYDQQAFRMLNQWISARYPEIHQQHVPQGRSMDDETVPIYELYDSVSAQLLQAARTQNEIDADVQVALGVLFYNSGQYDKSVDCFDTAVKVRPNDYLLWNRLGATLANSGRSEEAISAYYHALDIKPSFVRGRYNLGVSCMNIGCYKEAAEHFLTALLMHQTPGDAKYASSSSAVKHSNESNNLWETLRRTFILMERPDLSEIAEAGADLERFRKDFDF